MIDEINNYSYFFWFNDTLVHDILNHEHCENKNFLHLMIHMIYMTITMLYKLKFFKIVIT